MAVNYRKAALVSIVGVTYYVSAPVFVLGKAFLQVDDSPYWLMAAVSVSGA